MLIPRYWAEARARRRAAGRQVTVRRFGWSNLDQDDAQSAAQARADEALARVLAGEALDRREPKRPYNGAEGVPIREEIVEEHGESVISRNSYGARCLNTPDVLFADIDFRTEPPPGLLLPMTALLILATGWLGYAMGGWKLAWPLAMMALLSGHALARLLLRLRVYASGGPEAVARRRIERFVAAHPDWRLRLYRTPAGFRTLALHRRFDPGDPAVAAFFTAVGADRMYVRMCQRQRCFRARLSPKPWRIGIGAHMKPRPGIWPVDPVYLPARSAWISDYERRAEGYAACRFVADLGTGRLDRDADEVRDLHDRACRAESTLPLA